MKRAICVILAICLCVLLCTGCGRKEPVQDLNCTYPHDPSIPLSASKDEVASRFGLTYHPEYGDYTSDSAVSIDGHDFSLLCAFDESGRMYKVEYTLIQAEESKNDIYFQLEDKYKGVYGDGINVPADDTVRRGNEWYPARSEEEAYKMRLTHELDTSVNEEPFLRLKIYRLAKKGTGHTGGRPGTYPHDRTMPLNAPKDKVVREFDLEYEWEYQLEYELEYKPYNGGRVDIDGCEFGYSCDFDYSGRMVYCFYMLHSEEPEKLFGPIAARLDDTYGRGKAYEDPRKETIEGLEWQVSLSDSETYSIRLTHEVDVLHEDESDVFLDVSRLTASGQKYLPGKNELDS